MLDDEVIRATVALADAGQRAVAAQRLARIVGADALIVLAEDRAVGAMLPAPGFAPTLPGGAAWRAFIDAAQSSGSHAGVLTYPGHGAQAAAVSRSGHGVIAVFIGGHPDASRLDSVTTLLPLVAGMLRAEHESVAAAGELRVARDQARQAETLAHALDATRSDVQRGMIELARQARALEEAHARAEEAARAKDEFLAMLGHELRNPLSPIVTALQLLRLKKHASRELDVIERQVETVLRLVDDLLDVSRITSGKVELRKVRVNVAEIIERAVETMSPALERKHQRLDVRVTRTGLYVDADPARLVQILSNLLTNASKYSNPGTRVCIHAERQEQNVRIAVTDEGIGLGPDMIHRVFDLFVQHRQAIDRSEGGLGLGLAIVRSLVGLHDGRVWAESEGEGRGSRFVVQLPAAETVAEPPERNALPTTTLQRRTHVCPRVLVVDDNNDARSTLTDALALLGYEVRSEADGPAAISVAAEFVPDVVLLDIGLPVMDGYEVAEQLRAMPATASVRLVAVTGYGQRSDRERSERCGFDAHLVKPVVLDELAQLLESLCAGQDLPAR
jgi:signal transduction histidine kinase/ActR/RegA family two-component response regulator